jgi:hypothetical protein
MAKKVKTAAKAKKRKPILIVQVGTKSVGKTSFPPKKKLKAKFELADGTYTPDIEMMVKDIKRNTMKTVKVLGSDVYVRRDWTHLVSIGHTTKMLQAAPRFLLLSKMEKEFAVKITSNLLERKEGESDLDTHKRADGVALKFMLERYPNILPTNIIKCFYRMVEDKLNDFNCSRVGNVVEKLIILYSPKKEKDAKQATKGNSAGKEKRSVKSKDVRPRKRSTKAAKKN